VVFDLLLIDGEDLGPLPLHERRRRLSALVKGAPDALVFSAHVENKTDERSLSTPAR
jgi:ATP-dependent DNA ligase